MQNTKGEPIRRWNERSRTSRTHEVPFIAGWSHFPRKNTRFRSPASSPTQAPCNIHAAMTMRFEAALANLHVLINAHGTTRWQQSCSHSTAICHHRFKNRIELRTHEQPHVAEHQGGTDSTKRARPHKPHTRGTFHRRLKPLSTEKHKVSFSGFLPNTSPMQHSCSHYTAFCSITWQTRISLRTWQQNMTRISHHPKWMYRY